MKTILIVVLLIILSLSVQAADSSITVTNATGGWLVTCKVTNPAAVTNSPLNLAFTATVDVDGVAQTPVDSTIDLSMYSSVMTKKWVSKTVLPTWASLGTVTGDGTAVVGADGKLNFSVIAPNDGQPHTMTFKLIYKYSIAWLDWLYKPSSLSIQNILTS